MTGRLAIAACVLAVALAGAFAFYGVGSLVFALPLVLVAVILYDYRVAVVFLTIALPFEGSPLIPQAQGFNPITYCVLAALVSLCLKRLFRLRDLVLLPKVTVLCVMVPLFAGALIALPHLKQGMYNFSNESWAITYETGNYLKLYLMRPMTFVIFAVLVANAVRDSDVPERFLGLLVLASVLPAIGVLAVVATGENTLDDLESKRSFLGDIGMHSNTAGRLLSFIFAPLLWLTFSIKGFKRLLVAVATLLVLAGVMLTMTRAAYLAVFVVIGVFLWQRKQVGLTVVIVSAVVIFFAVGPEAFRERILQGLDSSTIESAAAGSDTERLTAGRTNGYMLLAPEVLKSPVWGSGTASTAWSDAVSERKYFSIHPHNLYLSAAMDIGLLGLGLMLFFYLRHIKMMKTLADDDRISSVMRTYFAGSAVGLMGMLVFGLTNGTWFPEADASLMWATFGITYAYCRMQAAPALVQRRAPGNRLSPSTIVPGESARPGLKWR